MYVYKSHLKSKNRVSNYKKRLNDEYARTTIREFAPGTMPAELRVSAAQPD